jgi:arylsulfatase
MTLQKLPVTLLVALALVGLMSDHADAAKPKKPNILVIWGDDIGQSNLSTYTRGMMGYRTPNIDRIAREGMIFTDYYGEQSCTAGRSSFLLGQSVFRTGLSKVGLPGAKEGISTLDPTIAGLLKDQFTISMPKRSPKTKTTPATWCSLMAHLSSSDSARVA